MKFKEQIVGQNSKSLLGDELDLVCRKTYYFFVLLLKTNSERTLEGSLKRGREWASMDSETSH